jgi:hypothetical protein
VEAAVAAADLELDGSMLAAIGEIVRSAQDPTRLSTGSG